MLNRMYEHGGVEIYHGDCLEVLPTIPACSIDLILCDPPYGITSAGFDCEINLQRLWPELWRVSKPHCPVILTASQPFSSVVTMSQVSKFKHEWVWIKNAGSNFTNTMREPMKEHEVVLVFAKDKWTYNRQMQERTGGGAERVKTPVKFETKSENYRDFESREHKMMSELRVPSSWQKFNRERGLHPQQKPVDLFRYLIRTYSDLGMTVLDFACGSGTTAVAAVQEGRKCVCIEKEQRFVEVSISRLGGAPLTPLVRPVPIVHEEVQLTEEGAKILEEQLANTPALKHGRLIPESLRIDLEKMTMEECEHVDADISGETQQGTLFGDQEAEYI
jgi:site-specific DNA-methyltransferase (adenine-specific)